MALAWIFTGLMLGRWLFISIGITPAICFGILQVFVARRIQEDGNVSSKPNTISKAIEATKTNEPSETN